MSSERPSPTRKFAGEVIKNLRTRAGLSREEFGERISFSVSMVSAVERGDRMPTREYLDRAEEVLQSGGLLPSIAPMLALERYPPWFKDFAGLEAEAASHCSYETHIVPGLLQTEEYARALFRMRVPPLDDDEIDRLVAARLDRQSLIQRKPLPVLGFVIEEWVLRRPLGGRKVLRGQLDRLLECSRLRHVSIQVMPMDREEHAGVHGPMVLLETAERRHLAYVEAQGGSTLISKPEELSVLHQRYGIIRAQALTPGESASLIQQVAGEL